MSGPFSFLRIESYLSDMFYSRAILEMAEQFEAIAKKKKKKKKDEKWSPLSKKHREAIFEAFNESVGDCIKHMEDKPKKEQPSSPGAFCSSLKDSLEGTDWRKGERKKKKKASIEE